MQKEVDLDTSNSNDENNTRDRHHRCVRSIRSYWFLLCYDVVELSPQRISDEILQMDHTITVDQRNNKTS